MAAPNMGHPKLAAPGRSAVPGRVRSHQGVDGLDHEGTLNSEQRIEKKAAANQIGFRLSLIIVIEQWLCLVLGIVCMVLGILGISVRPGQSALPAHHAWAGLGYVTLLRITAAACLAVGVVLVRLGWTQPLSAAGRWFTRAKCQGGVDEKR
jgi:hypothetical protein